MLGGGSRRKMMKKRRAAAGQAKGHAGLAHFEHSGDGDEDTNCWFTVNKHHKWETPEESRVFVEGTPDKSVEVGELNDVLGGLFDLIDDKSMHIYSDIVLEKEAFFNEINQERFMIRSEYQSFFESVQNQISSIANDKLSKGVEGNMAHEKHQRDNLEFQDNASKNIKQLHDAVGKLQTDAEMNKTRVTQAIDLGEKIEAHLRGEIDAGREENRGQLKVMKDMLREQFTRSDVLRTEFETMKEDFKSIKQDMVSLQIMQEKQDYEIGAAVQALQEEFAKELQKLRDELGRIKSTSGGQGQSPNQTQSSQPEHGEDGEIVVNINETLNIESFNTVRNEIGRLASSLDTERRAYQSAWEDESRRREQDVQSLQLELLGVTEKLRSMQTQIIEIDTSKSVALSTASFGVNDAAARERKEVLATVAALRGEVDQLTAEYTEHLQWGHLRVKQEVDDVKSRILVVEDRNKEALDEVASLKGSLRSRRAEAQGPSEKTEQMLMKLVRVEAQSVDLLERVQDHAKVINQMPILQSAVEALQGDLSTQITTSQHRFDKFDELVRVVHQKLHERVQEHQLRLDDVKRDIDPLKRSLDICQADAYKLRAELDCEKAEGVKRNDEVTKLLTRTQQNLDTSMQNQSLKLERDRCEIQTLVNTLQTHLNAEKAAAQRRHEIFEQSQQRTNKVIEDYGGKLDLVRQEVVPLKRDLYNMQSKVYFLQADWNLQKSEYQKREMGEDVDEQSLPPLEALEIQSATTQKDADSNKTEGQVECGLSQVRQTVASKEAAITTTEATTATASRGWTLSIPSWSNRLGNIASKLSHQQSLEATVVTVAANSEVVTRQEEEAARQRRRGVEEIIDRAMVAKSATLSDSPLSEIFKSGMFPEAAVTRTAHEVPSSQHQKTQLTETTCQVIRGAFKIPCMSNIPTLDEVQQKRLTRALQSGGINFHMASQGEGFVAELATQEQIDFWPVRGISQKPEYWSRETATRILSSVATIMEIYPSAILRIEAHSATQPDDMGEWAHDITLARATFVQDALEGAGVSSARMQCLGLPGILGNNRNQVVFKICRFM